MLEWTVAGDGVRFRARVAHGCAARVGL
jgi:hypothetical protein